MPRLHYKGQQESYYVMVMDLLGPSLVCTTVWAPHCMGTGGVGRKEGVLGARRERGQKRAPPGR